MKPSQLLAKPEAWTQGVYARNLSGGVTEPNGPAAASWCVVGACYKCFGVQDETMDVYLNAVFDLLPDKKGGIHWWNDAPSRTHAEVLAVLRKAESTLGL